jgi:hypothetical protein
VREHQLARDRRGGDVALDDGVVGFAPREEPRVLDTAVRLPLPQLDVGRHLVHGGDHGGRDALVFAAGGAAGNREGVLAALDAALDVLRGA